MGALSNPISFALKTVFVLGLAQLEGLPFPNKNSASMGISMEKWPKWITWPKITFLGSKMVPKVSKWGVLGGVFVLKSGLRILIRAPEVPFSVKWNKNRPIVRGPKNAFFVPFVLSIYRYLIIFWQSISKQYRRIRDARSWMRNPFFLCQVCLKTQPP